MQVQIEKTGSGFRIIKGRKTLFVSCYDDEHHIWGMDKTDDKVFKAPEAAFEWLMAPDSDPEPTALEVEEKAWEDYRTGCPSTPEAPYIAHMEALRALVREGK